MALAAADISQRALEFLAPNQDHHMYTYTYIYIYILSSVCVYIYIYIVYQPPSREMFLCRIDAILMHPFE